MKEMLGLARKVRRSFVSSQHTLTRSKQFTYAGLMDFVTAEMVSSMSSITLEKVFEETFSGPPLYAASLVDSSHY